MKILLYAFFTNDYKKLLPYWIIYTANNFYVENTDVLVITDDENIKFDNPRFYVKYIKSNKFRNIELWNKNIRHCEILDEYKDKYDLFAYVQSNCFFTQKVDETNFPLDKDKITVFEHTGTTFFNVLRTNICKVGSCGYKPLSLYDEKYHHAGICFGNYDNLYKMNKDCHQMYLTDFSKNKLHKVPYHDESFFNSWRVDNKDKVTILPRIDSGDFKKFFMMKKLLYLVDKHDLGVMKNEYIIPKFIPNTRFGNWLFLIAACYAHCLRNGYEMRLPNEKPLLNKLLPIQFSVPQEIDMLGKSTYNETTYHYSPIPKDHVGFISGFFQSSKYFSDFKEEIKELFGNLKADHKKEGVAGIHVRMGDYLKLSQRFKSPTKDFIERAIKELSPHIKRLLVFSDEIDKAIELVKSCKGSERFTITPSNDIGETDEIHDIYFMTSCEEFIMSCSSFSWWAAYLGNHKKVIVDKKWYNDNQLKEDDIYEKSWIKI